MPEIPAGRPAFVVALVIVAAAVRAAALWQFGDQLHNDPDGYRVIAESLVAGRGLSFPTPDHDDAVRLAYRPPLYPCLLAPLVACCRGDETLLNLAIGTTHVILGAATVLLVVLAGRKLALGCASLLAGFVAAVDPLLAYNTALVMTETTATFLAALFLWLSVSARSNKGRFLAGFVFGLCSLCRPTFWAVGAFAAMGWLCGQWWRNRQCANGRRVSATLAVSEERGAARSGNWWRPGLVVAAGTALAVAPWIVRNAWTMGRPILTTTHGGYTLLLAHNPVYTREVVDRPWGAVWETSSIIQWQKSLEAELNSETPPLGLSHLSPTIEIARDRWMGRKAREYIGSDPATAVRAGLTLLGRFWNIAPMSTGTRTPPQWLRWAICAFYVTLFSAMFLGLCRLKPAEWGMWWPLVSLLLGFTAIHSLYWADMRMRAPLVPTIALLAARAFRLRSPDRVAK